MTKEQQDSVKITPDKEIGAGSVVQNDVNHEFNDKAANREADPEVLKAAKELAATNLEDSLDKSSPSEADEAKPFESGPTIKSLRERIAVVIPCYNHGTLVEPVVKRVIEYGLTCIVVDDGSSQGSITALKEIQSRYDGIHVLYHLQNGGKGGAVLTGLRLAKELGFSHILQVDADGQHNLDDLPKFFALNAKYPKAIIACSPIYRQDAPQGMLFGHKLNNFMVMVETFSKDIKESMCGYRIYPVKELMALYDRDVLPRAMDFDVSVLVNSYWNGLDVLYVDSKVRYLINGHSNFRKVQDSLKITLMHAGLVLNTLLHVPSRILDKIRRKDEFNTKGKRISSFVKSVNEAEIDSDGNLIFKKPEDEMPLGSFAVRSNTVNKSSDESKINADAGAARTVNSSSCDQRKCGSSLSFVSSMQNIFGNKVCSYLVYPVAGWYWLTDSKHRNFSSDFLEVVTNRREEIVTKEAEGKHHLVSTQWSREPLTTYRHFVHMGNTLLARLNVWHDKSALDDEIIYANGVKDLLQKYQSQGCVILTSHIGNKEILHSLVHCSSLSDQMNHLIELVFECNQKDPLCSLGDLHKNSKFSTILVKDANYESCSMIKSKLENNEWLAMVADYFYDNDCSSENIHGRQVDFLGQKAVFDERPFALACSMNVDVLQLFAIKDQDKTFIYAYKLADAINDSELKNHIKVMMDRYAHHLELQAINYPLEWFNLYPFWKQPMK